MADLRGAGTITQLFVAPFPYITDDKSESASGCWQRFLSQRFRTSPTTKTNQGVDFWRPAPPVDGMGITFVAPYIADMFPYIADDIPYITDDNPYIADMACQQHYESAPEFGVFQL